MCNYVCYFLKSCESLYLYNHKPVTLKMYYVCLLVCMCMLILEFAFYLNCIRINRCYMIKRYCFYIALKAQMSLFGRSVSIAM